MALHGSFTFLFLSFSMGYREIVARLCISCLTKGATFAFLSRAWRFLGLRSLKNNDTAYMLPAGMLRLAMYWVQGDSEEIRCRTYLLLCIDKTTRAANTTSIHALLRRWNEPMVGVFGSWIQLALFINKTPIREPSKTSCNPCGPRIDLDGLNIETGVSPLW